jgi:low affinity Fe/Cu permease
VSEKPAPNLLFRRFALVADHVAHVTGHPLTFMFFCAAIVLWAVASIILRLSPGWQSLINTVITITTFLMVFLIQSTQSRDDAAVQAKLDELIRALEPANNQFIGIETRTIKEVHELRQETTDEVKKLEELVLEVAGDRLAPRTDDSDRQAASQAP